MLRKQAIALSAHRISFKYVTGGGSSDEPHIIHHIKSGRQLIHRLSASRKRNSLLTHIFSKAGTILHHLSWPLTRKMLAYAELRGQRRKSGPEVVESSPISIASCR